MDILLQSFYVSHDATQKSNMNRNTRKSAPLLLARFSAYVHVRMTWMYMQGLVLGKLLFCLVELFQLPETGILVVCALLLSVLC